MSCAFERATKEDRDGPSVRPECTPACRLRRRGDVRRGQPQDGEAPQEGGSQEPHRRALQHELGRDQPTKFRSEGCPLPPPQGTPMGFQAGVDNTFFGLIINPNFI